MKILKIIVTTFLFILVLLPVTANGQGKTAADSIGLTGVWLSADEVVAKGEVKIPAGYVFFIQASDETEQLFPKAQPVGFNSYEKSYIFRIEDIYDVEVLYTQVGTYEGQTYDLKMTVEDYVDGTNSTGVAYFTVASNEARGHKTISFNLGWLNSVTIKGQIINHETQEAADVKGYISFWDIDGGGTNALEFLVFNNYESSAFETVYVTENTELLYGIDNGHLVFYPSTMKEVDNLNAPQNAVTALLNGSEFTISYGLWHYTNSDTGPNPSTDYADAGSRGFDLHYYKILPTEISEPVKTVIYER